MKPIETAQPRRSMLSKLAEGRMLAKLAGCSLVAMGLLAAAVAPASADDDDWGHGHKHKHKHWKHRPHGPAYGYYYAPPPPPVYYQPAPVYYQPAPVYYQPPPVVVYPRKPSVSIVFPIEID